MRFIVSTPICLNQTTHHVCLIFIYNHLHLFVKYSKKVPQTFSFEPLKRKPQKHSKTSSSSFRSRSHPPATSKGGGEQCAKLQRRAGASLVQAPAASHRQGRHQAGHSCGESVAGGTWGCSCSQLSGYVCMYICIYIYIFIYI